MSLKNRDSKQENPLSLDDRVRSLKIAKEDRLDSQRTGSKVPWLVSIVLTILCGWLVYRDDRLMTFIGFERSSEETRAERTTQVASGAATSKQDSPATKSDSNALPKVSGTEKPAAVNPIALESRGYVIAKHQVLVSPQVSGRILSLNIEEGRRVVQGEVLAEVERTEYQADVEQMRGVLMRNKAELAELKTGARPQEIAGATADLQEQEEVVSQLESQYKRLKEALKTNSVSMTEFEQAQSSFFSTRKRIEKLRQSLDMM